MSVEYKIGGGVVNGYYKYLAEYMCSSVRLKKTDTCRVVDSTGAVENIIDNFNGINNIFLTQEDVAYNAFVGKGDFYSQNKHPKLMKVIKLYQETLNILVNKDAKSNLSSINDLKGKKVNVVGSRSNSIFFTRLQYVPQRWGSKDWENIVYSTSYIDSIKALCNNTIDAVVYVGGHINMQLVGMLNSCNLAFLSTSTPFLDGNKTYPYYDISIIPANTYSAKIEDVKAVSVYSMFATSSDVSEELVYKFLTDLFEALELLKIDNANIKLDIVYDIKRDIKQNKLPYHPGAIKFFKEKGYMK